MTSGMSSSSPPRVSPLAWIPRLSVMDRYIMTELVLPFLFGVGLFTSLGVSVGTVFELIRRVTESGLPLQLALEILLLNMPQFIAYSLPMSTLLATLMTYSRLAADSELVALRSCGVSVVRLVVPSIILSLVVTGGTFAFNELIVPAANYQAAVTLEKALNRDRLPFREENIVYQEFNPVQLENGNRQNVLTRFFYAREFDGERMGGVTYLDLSRPEASQIAIAEGAEWNLSNNIWDFYNGTIYVVSADGRFRNIVTFEQQQIMMPRTPLDLASRRRDYGEMNIRESLEELALVEQTGNTDRAQKLRVRIQQRYSLPFACLALGLVGASLGSRSSRTGRATSFAISVLMIFSYYLLASITGAIAQTGTLSPFLGAWIPNFVGIGFGLLLLLRVSR
jgi:lipopolysaccharide export system permease protein